MMLPSGIRTPPPRATWDAVVQALDDPAAYPHEVDRVDRIRTHISELFLAGDRVYKVKRPLRLAFLDYSTLERRLHYCEQEVLLNRRLAGATYRRVAPINRDPTGRIRVDGPGETVEYAVEMERLPHARLLDRLLEEGEVDNELAGRLARRLVAFHRAADHGPDVAGCGTAAAVRCSTEENLLQLESLLDHHPGLCGALLGRHLRGSLERFLAEEAPLLERRAEDGRIREGHGDLHAGNVCVLPDRLVIYDCIEFDRRLRCLDVAQDLAFLAMDLDHRGYRAFSAWLVRHYGEHAEDTGIHPLQRFYKTHLALVRAKVALLRAAGADRPEEVRDARREAQRYLHLAAGYSLPPVLVVMSGLPGSGKTFMAERLAGRLGCPIVHSDVTRKRLAGLPVHARPPAEALDELYSPEMTQRTYACLNQEARDLLAAGSSVIVDANCPTAPLRDRFLDLGAAQHAPRILVALTASAEETRRRLETRERTPAQASDADFRVYLALRERFDPPREGATCLAVHAPCTPEEVTAGVLERLLDQLARAGRLPTAFPR